MGAFEGTMSDPKAPVSQDHPEPNVVDVLPCPTLHDDLSPRPSPLIDGQYYGGGFVSPEDFVDIQAVHFSGHGPSNGAGARRRQGMDKAGPHNKLAVLWKKR